MGQPTAEQFAQRAQDLELLDERQVREIWAALGSRSVPLDDLRQLLVRREFMTSYQIDKVAKRDRSGFFYGPYKVLYMVGAGSFARVFRAVHRHTGKVVAIKVLRTRFSEDPEKFNQFVREGHVGCTLRHPNIVPIYEVFSQGKTHFLVMEFVEGWSLQDFVRIRKKVDPLQATKLVTDMAEGLNYAFEHGLTHRDLTLRNVLVSSDGQAKLVDFGLAALDESIADDALDDLPNKRTIDYAALERATGVRKDDTRSDIYFLGCIFYHMLTGLSPLSETRDSLQRLSKQRFLEVVPILDVDPTLPHWVVQVVNKSMMLDPTRRYQSPAALLADLRIVATQLANGQSAAASGDAADNLAAGDDQQRRSVMVVETNQKMQDILRKGLKRSGYRVLVISDPSRAINRFRQDAATADCVLFNAQDIGLSALESFNQLGEDKKTHFVRALLLLDEPQHGWAKDARIADHRKILAMPITMKQLRTALAELMGGQPGS